MQNRPSTAASPDAPIASPPSSGGLHPLNDARIVGRTIGGGLGATVQGFDQLDPAAPLAWLPAERLAQFEASLGSAQATLEAQGKRPTTDHYTGGNLTAFGSSPGHLSNFVETVPGDPFLDSIVGSRAFVQRAQAVQNSLWDPRVWQQTLTPSGLAQSYQTDPALERTKEAAAARIAGNVGNVTLQGLAGSAVGLPYLPAATAYFQAGAEARNEAEANYRQGHPEARDTEIRAVGDQAEAHARKVAAASGLLFAGMGKVTNAAARELLPSAMGAVPRAFATTGFHAAGNASASSLVRGADALTQGRSAVEAIS